MGWEKKLWPVYCPTTLVAWCAWWRMCGLALAHPTPAPTPSSTLLADRRGIDRRPFHGPCMLNWVSWLRRSGPPVPYTPTQKNTSRTWKRSRALLGSATRACEWTPRIASSGAGRGSRQSHAPEEKQARPAKHRDRRWWAKAGATGVPGFAVDMEMTRIGNFRAGVPGLAGMTSFRWRARYGEGSGKRQKWQF